MENSSIQLRCYASDDCSYLVDRCSVYHAHEQTDTWRRREWPFASMIAAHEQWMALSLQSIDDQTPCAYSIIDTSTHGDTVVGMIAVTHYDENLHCGLLGTYITPDRRGEGIQKLAKERLFQLLPSSVHMLYAIIALHNQASLHAMAKLTSKRLLSADEIRSLPLWITLELWKAGETAHVFHIDLAQYRGTQ